MMAAGRDHTRTGGAPGDLRSTLAYLSALLFVLLWAGCSIDSPSTLLRPTASPPPNPTTLSGITVSSPELVLREGETASVVITLNSDPGTDIEVWFRRGRTGADDIAFTPDRVAWAAADWQEPRTLALTASIDELGERLETHELHVWTYRLGEVGAGRHILPRAPIHVWVKDPLEPRAFAGGGAGEVVLEWPGWGEGDIQHWQYRYRDPMSDWGPWRSMPNSDADTRSFRVTGLSMPDRIYDFQIRPWGASGPGAASVVIEGYVALVGPDGIPQDMGLSLLEPGRRFRLSTRSTFVVPDGMLLSTGTTVDTLTGEIYVFVYDETTTARMVLRVSTSEVVQETFWDAKTETYQVIWTETGEIADSFRRAPPPPGHNLGELWDEIKQSIREEPLQ